MLEPGRMGKRIQNGRAENFLAGLCLPFHFASRGLWLLPPISGSEGLTGLQPDRRGRQSLGIRRNVTPSPCDTGRTGCTVAIVVHGVRSEQQTAHSKSRSREGGELALLSSRGWGQARRRAPRAVFPGRAPTGHPRMMPAFYSPQDSLEARPARPRGSEDLFFYSGFVVG